MVLSCQNELCTNQVMTHWTHDTLRLIALEIPDKETMRSFSLVCKLTNRIFNELKNEWGMYCNHQCIELAHIRLIFLAPFGADTPSPDNKNIDIHCECCKSSQIYHKLFNF